MTFEKGALSKETGTLKIRSLHEIPALYSNTRTKDPVAYVRLQAPWLNKSWYVFEWNGGDRFFGMEAEFEKKGHRYGLYSLSDLAALRGPLETIVTQDHTFQPIPLSQMRKYILRRN